MILHYFSSTGWQEWDVQGQPMIRSGMPVLVDDDLRFEDDGVPRATAAMNRWLGELPISGAPSPCTWRAYAQALKAWALRAICELERCAGLVEQIAAQTRLRTSGTTPDGSTRVVVA